MIELKRLKLINWHNFENVQESSISEKIKELRTDLKMNQKNFSAAIGAWFPFRNY